MRVEVLHFDVFTDEPGKGNPAGIVLATEGWSEEAMQAIAARMRFGDTAFLSSSSHADFRIRYFSPRKEVDLCGHATVAAALALRMRGMVAADLPLQFDLETRAGVLQVVLESGSAGETLVVMTQAPGRFKAFTGDRMLLCRSLGIAAADLHPTLPIVYGSTGRWTLVVPVRDLEVMRRMRPHTEMFSDVLAEVAHASMHPFCLETIGEDVDMHARHFSAPGSGTVEDPVTGTASGVLGAYYHEFIEPSRDPSRPVVVEQGHEVGREGRVWAWAQRSAGGYVVRIAGTACFVESIYT